MYPQGTRKPFRDDSKLPDHNCEEQEAQGCPPSRIKETQNLDVYFAFQHTCMLYFFWKAQYIRKPFEVTPSFLIIIRNLKEVLHIG